MSHSEGFLASSVSTSVANIHRDFVSWFGVAESFNGLAMRVLPTVKADQESSQQLIAAALYGRTLMSFQAAYILTERGMLADARTVVRAATETAIVLSAVVRDAPVCDRLVDRHFWQHVKLRNAWLNDPEAVAGMTCQEVDAVKSTIAEAENDYPKVKELNHDPVAIAALADKAGVTALYNAVYRPTSGDAAHTSIDALNRHIQADAAGDIEGLKFGPDVGDLPATLSDAISVLGHGLAAVIEFFSLSQFSDDLAQCVASWKALPVPMGG
jgi:Family of unknown function (DUF5677)